jgi:hypothetical protein
MTFRGAEQRFLLLFLEKEEYCGLYIAWGQAPKPPGLASLEVLGMYDLPRSGTTLFASFSGKRRILWLIYCLGASPQTPRARFARSSGHV